MRGYPTMPILRYAPLPSASANRLGNVVRTSPGYSGSEDSRYSFIRLMHFSFDRERLKAMLSGPISRQGSPSLGMNTPAVSKEGQ